MSESTLSLRYIDLAARVGSFLGYGRGEAFDDTPWTTSQQAGIDDCIDSGYRQFLFPPPMGGIVHDWSFLKPVATLTLVSGAQSVLLPDDFGGAESPVIRVSTSGGQSFETVPIVGDVRHLYTGSPDVSGWPQQAAIEPIKGTSANKGQRFQLSVYPAADQDYTLLFPYTIWPDALRMPKPFAYGGMAHAETLLESCLAIAEQRLDDAASVHTMKWMERLAASVALDRRNKPQMLGYNGDRSGSPYGMAQRHQWGTRVTFFGTQY